MILTDYRVVFHRFVNVRARVVTDIEDVIVPLFLLERAPRSGPRRVMLRCWHGLILSLRFMKAVDADGFVKVR